MKNRLFFSGIISILLIFGFLTGCDNGTTNKEVVEVPMPGDTIIDEGPRVTLEPPQTGGERRKQLLKAEEDYAMDSSVIQVIPVTRELSIPGNSSITVPDYVVLEIRKGVRFTIESNAFFYVRPHGVVDVKGDLYFDEYAQGDDVRQTKIEGKILVNGGLVYDKSKHGSQLQYVTSIRNGGQLYFAGGEIASGGTRETAL